MPAAFFLRVGWQCCVLPTQHKPHPGGKEGIILKVHYRRFYRGALIFQIEVNGVVYAGCYLIDGITFLMYSSADDYACCDRKRNVGGWSHKDIRKLAWLGKVRTKEKSVRD